MANTDKVTEVASLEERKRSEPGFGHVAARLNKFTLLCALLASTNSILLGYGESLWFLLLNFVKE